MNARQDFIKGIQQFLARYSYLFSALIMPLFQ